LKDVRIFKKLQLEGYHKYNCQEIGKKLNIFYKILFPSELY